MTSIGRFLVRCVREQRQLPRAHDRDTQRALMLRARARDAPRQHLAALRHEAAQQLDVLVVDVVDLVRAELADFATPEEPAALAGALRVFVLVVAAAAASAARPASLCTHWHD